jgi:hypothetical protein
MFSFFSSTIAFSYLVFTGENGDGKNGKQLHYKNSKFHRIIKVCTMLIFFLLSHLTRNSCVKAVILRLEMDLAVNPSMANNSMVLSIL